MQVSVLKSDGADSGKKLDLADATFDASYNEALIHQVVTAYQAGGRSGTRAQKNRSAVAGGGAKPYRFPHTTTYPHPAAAHHTADYSDPGPLPDPDRRGVGDLYYHLRHSGCPLVASTT